MQVSRKPLDGVTVLLRAAHLDAGPTFQQVSS